MEEVDWERPTLRPEHIRYAADEAWYSLQVYLMMRLRKERRNPRRDKTKDAEIDKRQRQHNAMKGKGICVKAETDESIANKVGICVKAETSDESIANKVD